MDENEKYYVSLGMRAYGGGFVQALGMALTHADPINALKIKGTFRDYWNKYYELGRDEVMKSQPFKKDDKT